MQAVVVSEHGGPEALRLEEVPDPEAGPDDVVVELRAAALNRRDTYVRTGRLGFPPGVIPADIPPIPAMRDIPDMPGIPIPIPDIPPIPIEGMPGTREITVSGRTIRTRVDHGASAVPAALAALERSAAGIYENPGEVTIVDLSPRDGRGQTTVVASGTDIGWRAIEPAPPPRLVQSP